MDQWNVRQRNEHGTRRYAICERDGKGYDVERYRVSTRDHADLICHTLVGGQALEAVTKAYERWMTPDERSLAYLDIAIFYGVPRYGHERCRYQAGARAFKVRSLDDITYQDENNRTQCKYCSGCGKPLIPSPELLSLLPLEAEA